MTMSGSVFDVVTADKEENYSDAICTICDNGGELICCEGKCLRSFHATVEEGIDSACVSLELSDKIIKEGTFTCKNCQHNQHQCYVCGKLGFSDKSVGAEVFQCGSCTCGYFYHPSCVAKALQFVYEDDLKDVGAEIASGKPFICPLHFCYACKHKEQENETSVLLQFAVCRRCPIAYHRKCLPGTIAFEDDDDEGIIARAWDDLIPNKILIYCLEHVIDEDMQTPVRDHLKFPCNMEKKKQVKRNLSKPSERGKSEKLQEEGQLERSYDLPKRRFASKTALQKSSSSSASYRNCSGLYSFRDRKLVTKYRMAPLLAGLKKKVCKLVKNSSSGKNMVSSSSEKRSLNSTEVEGSGISGLEEEIEGVEKEVAAVNDDFVVSKLENQESSGTQKKRKTGEKIPATCENDSLATVSENQHRKQSKIIKEGSAVSDARKLENQEASGSEKRNESVEKVACSKDSVARMLENHVSYGSKNTHRSTKELEASEISGLEKQRKRFNEVATRNNDSVVSKLENQESSNLEKRSEIREKIAAACENDSLAKIQSKIIKEIAAVSVVSKLENQEASGSEKQNESVEKVARSKDSMARMLENRVSFGSKKTRRSTKEMEASEVSGLEKQRQRLLEVATHNKDSLVSKLKYQQSFGSLKKRKRSENRHSFGSFKNQSKAIKAVATVSAASKLESPKASDLEKRRENVKTVAAGSKGSMASKLENHVCLPSEKTSRINKEVEEASGTSVSEKQRERSKEVAAACNNGSVVKKSENQEKSSSEKRKDIDNRHSFGPVKKQSKIIKDVAAAAAVSSASNLENREVSGSVKRIESVEKLAGSKDSKVRKLENHMNSGLEKTIRSNKVEVSRFSGSEKQREMPKEVAAAAASYNDSNQDCSEKKKKKKKLSKIVQEVAAVSDASKLERRKASSLEKGGENIKQVAVKNAEEINNGGGGGLENEKKNDFADSSSSVPKSFSKTTFKTLGFYCGPYHPPTEHNSVGWLVE